MSQSPLVKKKAGERDRGLSQAEGGVKRERPRNCLNIHERLQKTLETNDHLQEKTVGERKSRRGCGGATVERNTSQIW